MKKYLLMAILLLLWSTCFACEFGTTYMDRNLNGDGIKPNNEELQWCKQFPNVAFYCFQVGCYVDRAFNNHGHIEITTGYTWCGSPYAKDLSAKNNPPPKGECPYVLYKGHRWYPNYHGTIYVYKDGREVR